MIQKAFITQWGAVVPWSSPRLVEQDLIICRALVSIFSDTFLKEHLANVTNRHKVKNRRKVW